MPTTNDTLKWAWWAYYRFQQSHVKQCRPICLGCAYDASIELGIPKPVWKEHDFK